MPPGTAFPMNKKHAHAVCPRAQGRSRSRAGRGTRGKSRRFSKTCHRLTWTGRGHRRRRAIAKARGRTNERADEEESTDRKRVKAEDDDGGGGDGGKF